MEVTDAFIKTTLAVISLVILIQVMAPFYTTYSVTGENHGTVIEGTVIQLNNHPVVEASEKIYADGALLTRGTNYTVISYEEGKFNITDLDGNATLTSSATITVDYVYTDTSYVDSPIARTVLRFVPVLGAVLVMMALTKFM